MKLPCSAAQPIIKNLLLIFHRNNSFLINPNNEIYDIPYTAITCGVNHSLMSYNKIHDGLKVLTDESGINITFWHFEA